MRDIVLFGKRRYKDFLGSDEGIATNILSDRLTRLEQHGIVEKMCEQYLVTEKGFNLLPILTEMGMWGSKYDPQTASPEHLVELAKNNPTRFRKEIEKIAFQNSKLDD